jgi:serine/threonine protein kinase
MLADLGSVVTLDELDQLEGGTIGYASPERYDRDGLGSKVDVWALG